MSRWRYQGISIEQSELVVRKNDYPAISTLLHFYCARYMSTYISH
jgi:hypothetical protein